MEAASRMMADYNKLKVVELKDKLKARGIPVTGLKLKQNYIDKLIEADALGQTNTSSALVAPSGTPEHTKATGEDSAADPLEPKSRHEKALNHDSALQPALQESIAQSENVRTFPTSQDAPTDGAADEAQLQCQQDADIVSGEIKQEAVTVDSTIAPTAVEETASGTRQAEETPESVAATAEDRAGSQSTHPAMPETLPPSSLPAPSLATSIPPVPAQEWVEDSKKRKRRSVSPPPSAAEVAQKRARASNGSPRITKPVSHTSEDAGLLPAAAAAESLSQATQAGPSSLEQMDVAADDDGDDDGDDDAKPSPKDGLLADEQLEAVGATSMVPSGDEIRKDPTSDHRSDLVQSPAKQSIPHGPSASLFAGLKRKEPGSSQDLPEGSTLPYADAEERIVAPALHPATSSLYMRNFKRPLHLPTLRAHLATVARGPLSSSTADEDPIVAYFLDSIRTHALVSFRSVSAASRVRSALHDMRYPDEKTRDPLWIDFIPDDQVQSWIDLETKSGVRGGTQRWEVVYEESASGIEAVLREVGAGAGAGPRGPGAVPQRQPLTSNIQRQLSVPEVPRPPAVAGVHPDRLPLVPQHSTDVSHPRREHDHKATRQETYGTGFRALDELFSYTTAKPKLYYKPVSPRLATRRMEMIKDLRVSHADMGKSGDEDMKRYSFDVYRGEEEWVDKGPEFGYGRRGLERMRGGAPLRGGYRRGGGGGGGAEGGSSRGAFRERDRDDTWRGRR